MKYLLSPHFETSHSVDSVLQRIWGILAVKTISLPPKYSVETLIMPSAGAGGLEQIRWHMIGVGVV